MNELAFRIRFEFDISSTCFKKFQAISLSASLSVVFLESRSTKSSNSLPWMKVNVTKKFVYFLLTVCGGWQEKKVLMFLEFAFLQSTF